MNFKLHIFTWMNTKTFLGPTFLLLPAFFVLPDIMSGDVFAAITPLLMMICIFTSITLHEFGHIKAAKMLGIKTGDVTLHLFGGVADIEADMKTGKNEMIISLAGPAVNAVILLLILPIVFWMRSKGLTEGPFYDVIFSISVVNIILFLFNLLPLFPMDGGRLLRGALRGRFGRLRATEIAVAIAFVVSVFVCIFGFIHSYYMVVVIAPILTLAGMTELKEIRKQA